MALLVVAHVAAAAGLQVVGDRFIGDDGRPTALTWAFGLHDIPDLDTYRAMGFNTVYLDLPAADQEDARQAVRLADEAAAHGFKLILGLNAVAAVRPGMRVAPGDPSVIHDACAWIAGVVGAWRETPGLVLYALDHELEDRLAWTQEGLALYLAQGYQGRIAELNLRWGTSLTGFGQITPEVLEQADAGRPCGLGRAAMDRARWGMDRVSDLLAQLATACHAADPVRPVLGGRMSLGRTLLVAPRALAGLQPAMLPGGPDERWWHNLETVPAARQGGRFAVAPTLEAEATPEELRRWTLLAVGRGAAGVGYSSWPALRDNPARGAAVKQVLADIDQAGLASFAPTPDVAVVLQPFCRGPLRGGRAVWGYGDFGGDEPAALLELLRRGTRYGPLDVLTAPDLAGITPQRYRLLFLPAVLDLSALDAVALGSYVAGGGSVVADLGLGSYDPDGDLSRLPDPLSDAFGLVIGAVRPLAAVELRGRHGDRLRDILAGGDLFPELQPGLSRPGSLVFKRSSSQFPLIVPVKSAPPAAAQAFLEAPAAFVAVGPDTRMIAELGQLGRQVGQPALIAGLSVHRTGSATACFAGTFLWQGWGPGEPLFDAMCDGFLGVRPGLDVLSAAALSPAQGEVEAVRQGDRIWLHRLRGDSALTSLELASLDGRLYRGGLNVLRRTPVLDPSAPYHQAGEPLLNRRLVILGGGEQRLDEPLPITLWPLGDPVAAEVRRYEAQNVELTVFGSGERAEVDRRGQWWVEQPAPAPAVLEIHDGLYPVPPGSTHELTRQLPHQVGSGFIIAHDTVTAGPDGKLRIHDLFQAEIVRLRLETVPAPPPAATE